MKTFSVILVAIITSVLTTAGLLFADARFQVLQFQPPEPETPEQKTVPNLVGLMEADAKANVEAMGFKLLIGGRQPSTAAAPGSVIEQIPAAGHMLEVGQPVELTFALPVASVPDVVGQTKEDATKALEEAGYTVEIGEPIPHAEIAEGSVVSQTPKAGTPLEADAAVSIQTSSGPASVEVPKLSGMSLRAAEAAAEELGLKVDVRWVSLAETITHRVLRQTPAPGESVEPGTEIRVTINR